MIKVSTWTAKTLTTFLSRGISHKTHTYTHTHTHTLLGQNDRTHGASEMRHQRPGHKLCCPTKVSNSYRADSKVHSKGVSIARGTLKKAEKWAKKLAVCVCVSLWVCERLQHYWWPLQDTKLQQLAKKFPEMGSGWRRPQKAGVSIEERRTHTDICMYVSICT